MSEPADPTKSRGSLSTSVCVVTWNSEAEIGPCLESLLAQSEPPVEILVVDNASSDATMSWVESFGSAVRSVRHERNLGFAAAVNRAFRETAGALFATVNPDVRLDPGYLRAARVALERHPRAGGVQGVLTLPDGARAGKSDPDGGAVAPAARGRDAPASALTGRAIDSTGIVLGRDLRARDRTRLPRESEGDEVFAVCAAAAVYRRAALEEVAYPGGEVFDEAFFAYKEDVDLGWRLRDFGWTSRCVPDARGEHARGWRPGARERVPPWIRVHSLKNRYLTLVKNCTGGDLLRSALPLAWFEARALVYLLLVEPGSLRVFPSVVRHLRDALEKRKWQRSRLDAIRRTGRGEARREGEKRVEKTGF